MINHSRPRQTTWEYNESEDAFIITAVTKLYAGDQVMDSYGRRDNRRFFFCYGFVEDDNIDGNNCSPNTVAVAVLHRHPAHMNGMERPAEGVVQSVEEMQLNEEEDCGFFWNSIVLDVMERIDSVTEDIPAEVDEMPSDDAVNLGALVSARTQWILQNSPLLTGNLVVFNHDCMYDHQDSQYLYLSMCHDDAGTTSLFSIISFLFKGLFFLNDTCES